MEKQKLGKRMHVSQVRDNNVSSTAISRTPEGLRRVRGAHSSFVHTSEWIGGRQLAVPPNYNASGL